MAHAVTHILIPIILIDLFRDYFVKDKRNFPLHYILIAGIAGMLPDLDIIIFWILSFAGSGIAADSIHRTFSHTLLIPLALIVLGLATSKIRIRELEKHHLKISTVLFVIAFGILTHLLLDFLVQDYIMPFYPISDYKAGINLIYMLPVSRQVAESFPMALDAILLVLWLVHEELKHKISDFI